jgi:dienelactone hydrolase
MTTPFVGTICTPGDGTKSPAVILLGGSEGGDSQSRAAALFARHGYVAASVAYFGAPGVQAALVDVPVETIGHVIDALSSRGDVDAARIGIMGASKGGEFALLAASTYPQIKAVVADVPSPFAFMGLGQYNIPTGCSWSRGGNPLPCIPPDAKASAAVGEAFSKGKPVVLRDLYDASRAADPAAAAAAAFPLENIAGPVLCLAGADDEMWNSPAYCDDAMSYLRQHQHPFAADDRAVSYPDAGHTFLWAVSGPQSAVTSVSLPGGATMEFGGTARGDAAAAQAAWPAIWEFFGKALHNQSG